MRLEGRLIRLRAVEPQDAEVLYAWENDLAVWAVSNSTEPFSREQIERFIERQLQGGDLFRTGQLRLMIETRGAEEEADKGADKGTGGVAGKEVDKGANGEAGREIGEGAGERETAPCRAVGTVDLFEYDPLHGRAGLGILIYDPHDRRLGYALDAVETLCRYARNHLRMHQLWCCIDEENTASRMLFRQAGFREVGIKQDWIWSPEGYRNEILLQKILD